MSLAFAFCDDVTPCGTFLHLKLLLLFSLVLTGESQNSEESPSLDLIVLATDDVTVERLLTSAASVCDKCVRHRSENVLTAAVVSDKHVVGAPFIEGCDVLETNTHMTS